MRNARGMAFKGGPRFDCLLLARCYWHLLPISHPVEVVSKGD